MKKYSLLILLPLLLFKYCDAKIWRVNNTSSYNGTTQWGSNMGGSQLYPVFKEINQAVGSTLVANGDTLYIEGSQIAYAPATITKSLVIIGAGYSLNENPNSSYNLYPTQVGTINFGTFNNQSANALASGSQLIGLWLTSTNTTNIHRNVRNVVIKRCRIDGQISMHNGEQSNIQILQNFFSDHSTTGSNTSLSTVNLGTNTPPLDVVFNNNICRGRLIATTFALLECKNNIFDPPNPTTAVPLSINITVGSFQNNILTNPSATININNGTNLHVSYNTAASPNQFGTSNNNIVTDMTALFVDPAVNSTDGDYQLKPGSTPGSDGAERGAFGGTIVQNRYMLSGLPAIPVIYEINTSGVATPTGLPVQIKARTIQ